jgi:hypothetical protein
MTDKTEKPEEKAETPEEADTRELRRGQVLLAAKLEARKKMARCEAELGKKSEAHYACQKEYEEAKRAFDAASRELNQVGA